MQFDHIAVSGETLAEAVAYVEERLGVKMQPGGAHDVFFTHNCLLGLADGLYLEAIAVNPAAPQPSRPRWFDLDRFDGAARLSNWICRTDQLDHDLTDLPAAVGQPVALKRGDLRWRMAVPDDGMLPFDNLFPALIQWDTPTHPSAMLADSGCALHELVVAHPEAEALQSLLVPHLTDPRISFLPEPSPRLEAVFDTPHGRRTL